MVNITTGVLYGGDQVVVAGDRVDNQHVYYPMKFNKKAGLAITKGDILFADPTDAGKLRLADTGDVGPFYMAYEDTPAGDPKVHCWHDEGNWLIANIVGATDPNTKLVPVDGKLTGIGSDTTSGVYGLLLGTPDQEAELTSGNVLQKALTGDGLGVVKVHNIERLPTA